METEKAKGKRSISEERLAEFRQYSLKPSGCLKSNIGCRKTNHFQFIPKKGIVRCMFDKEKGCTSPFPRKEKPTGSSSKATDSSKHQTEKDERMDERVPPIKKIHHAKPKKKKSKIIQMEFEIRHPSKKLKGTKESKADSTIKHSEKSKKHKAKGFF